MSTSSFLSVELTVRKISTTISLVVSRLYVRTLVNSSFFCRFVLIPIL
jgi:hypothetical protein